MPSENIFRMLAHQLCWSLFLHLPSQWSLGKLAIPLPETVPKEGFLLYLIAFLPYPVAFNHGQPQISYDAEQPQTECSKRCKWHKKLPEKYPSHGKKFFFQKTSFCNAPHAIYCDGSASAFLRGCTRTLVTLMNMSDI